MEWAQLSGLSGNHLFFEVLQITCIIFRCSYLSLSSLPETQRQQQYPSTQFLVTDTNKKTPGFGMATALEAVCHEDQMPTRQQLFLILLPPFTSCKLSTDILPLKYTEILSPSASFYFHFYFSSEQLLLFLTWITEISSYWSPSFIFYVLKFMFYITLRLSF